MGRDPEHFVFFSPVSIENIPIGIGAPRDNLLRQLAKTQMAEEATWKNRKLREPIEADFSKQGICFHSWRHSVTTHLSRKTSKEVGKTITGHVADEMFKHYSDHSLIEDFKKAASAMEMIAKTFGLD